MEHRRKMENARWGLEDRLEFLDLEVESFSARWSDTAVRLEERVWVLEPELDDEAAEVECVGAEVEVEVEAEAEAKSWVRFEEEEKH